jgi:hypothetical protein
VDRCSIVIARSVDTHARDLDAAIKRDALDLGAAKVDPDSHKDSFNRNQESGIGIQGWARWKASVREDSEAAEIASIVDDRGVTNCVHSGSLPRFVEVNGDGTSRAVQQCVTEIESYRDLFVWQKSMDLAVRCYRAAQALPKSEQSVLGYQVRKSSVSIPSNVAEGHSRHSTPHYIQHLWDGTCIRRRMRDASIGGTESSTVH